MKNNKLLVAVAAILSTNALASPVLFNPFYPVPADGTLAHLVADDGINDLEGIPVEVANAALREDDEGIYELRTTAEDVAAEALRDADEICFDLEECCEPYDGSDIETTSSEAIRNSDQENATPPANSNCGSDDDTYKTELCKNFAKQGSCKYKEKCRFAHGKDELQARVVDPRYKRKLCKN